MKKIIIGLLAGIMVLSLAACGGSTQEEKNSKEHVYKAEEVALNDIEDKNSISSFFLRGDRLYVIGYNWLENGRETYIVSQNLDGSDPVMTTISLTENQSLNYLTVDESGNFYGVMDEYFEDSSDPDNYVLQDNYYLVRLDTEGKELWRQPLQGDSQDDYYYVSWMKLLNDGRIAIMDSASRITLYDTQGQQQKSVDMKEEEGMGDAIQMADGNLLILSYSSQNNKYGLRRLDVDAGKLSQEEYFLPGLSSSYSYYPGIGYDLMLVDNYGVSGYNLGDENVTELMNFIDSDINTSYIYSLVAVSDKEFYGTINDNLTGSTMLMKFTKVDPKDVMDKKVLTLACNGLNWDVRNQIVQFNKTNQQYRIRITDYTQYNTDEDYTRGVTKLNTDIASGNVPDILILDTNLPVESYISKGLFEDLYPYIDKDEELKRDNYFQNVLTAYETNGKLYQMVPSFTIFTVVGKTADVGAEPGWTMEDLNALMATKPEGTQVFAGEIRGSVLNYSIQLAGGQFIDWKTGECKFNSDAFISLLEFLKQFPEQYDDSYYTDEYWRSYDSMWRNGEVLLNVSYMDGFSSYNYMKKGTYGEDITLIGFPSADGKGSAIMPNMDIVMSSKSKNKDGVWQFMRYFLTDDYQNTIEYGWPLSLKRIDALSEKAKKKQSYEDENGKIVEYDQTYIVGGMEMPITPMTQEEIDEVLAVVKTIDKPYSYDQNLINIISEETAPYFAGQKNAKEVADIIQSRVQIYVNENR
ncbi:ABC-type glycerol-3-phosphate transport system substrate-binding protein [Kineothrix alysoides]|uniref:ABC-type glycerol-3-phosphate transport system substrate-binding protein n=1 Tax=Kineothrix alysoides TaxID=1469948 RepID=A0A4R1QRK8_9FIRM|nr:extracellular solute-binding protein [Kineothrix alysoides]TCL55651.1 ABC-type glycerol-3-phosphate transport system substrate-binding protein [Kineothrix alysoides]